MSALASPTLLVVVSLVVAVVYILVLFLFGRGIGHTLQEIGAHEPSVSNNGREPRSFLSRIWFGVRAIEAEVGHLAPEATRLNQDLAALAGGLDAIHRKVGAILEAAGAQTGSRPTGKGARA